MKKKNLILSSRSSTQWLDRLSHFLVVHFTYFTRMLTFFKFFIITNKCTIDTITVYIKTVSLRNLYFYMFRHFHVVIRQFTATALLSYIRSSDCSCCKVQFIKLRC